MDWNKINLKQFNLIQESLNIPDETERLIRISEIVFGDDITNLSLTDYANKVKELDFLTKEIPNNHLVNNIKVNNTTYHLVGTLGNITTAQYIDYTNHLKAGDFAKILSVFFIPKGHKYNDGYDILEVIKDMECLPMDVVNSTAFFFKRQLAKFMEIFLSSLEKKVKKVKTTKEQKEKLIKEIQHLESFPIY